MNCSDDKCNKPFTFFSRAHMCRVCIKPFCHSCTIYNYMPNDFYQENKYTTFEEKINKCVKAEENEINSFSAKFCNNCFNLIESKKKVNKLFEYKP